MTRLPSSGLLCQLPVSEFTLKEFDPLGWLTSLAPDSSLSLDVVPPTSLRQMSLATPDP
jgi:hypothetical protein